MKKLFIAASVLASLSGCKSLEQLDPVKMDTLETKEWHIHNVKKNTFDTQIIYFSGGHLGDRAGETDLNVPFVCRSLINKEVVNFDVKARYEGREVYYTVTKPTNCKATWEQTFPPIFEALTKVANGEDAKINAARKTKRKAEQNAYAEQQRKEEQQEAERQRQIAAHKASGKAAMDSLATTLAFTDLCVEELQIASWLAKDGKAKMIAETKQELGAKYDQAYVDTHYKADYNKTVKAFALTQDYISLSKGCAIVSAEFKQK